MTQLDHHKRSIKHLLDEAESIIQNYQYWAPALPSPNGDHGSILFLDNG